MERKSYTITLYKTDGRYKLGRTKVWCANFDNLTQAELADAVQVANRIACDYLDPRKVVIEYTEFRTVKSLMSGKEVQVAADTPLCCDPSSETYWSM